MEERLRQDTLLYGQLHEGLFYQLMEAPAVSGATSYTSLCLAVKNEEQRQAKLKNKPKQYQPNQLSSQRQSNRQSSRLQPRATQTLQQSNQQ